MRNMSSLSANFISHPLHSPICSMPSLDKPVFLLTEMKKDICLISTHVLFHTVMQKPTPSFFILSSSLTADYHWPHSRN